MTARMTTRGCEVNECERRHEAKGYCRLHYRRWKRNGSPVLQDRTPGPCAVKGCSAVVKARGWCEKHYCRWRSHRTTQDPRPVEEDRFWSKVDLGHPLGCWQWMGAAHPLGYGNFNSDDGHMAAHRWAFRQLRGHLPDELDHLCRNPPCVNPDHLEPVDHRENVLRGVVGFRSQNGTWGSW